MIDEKIFSSDQYYRLLKELDSFIHPDFTIEESTRSYFVQYKTMTSDSDDWDEESLENAQIYFNTKFFYEVDNSQYVGIYTDLDGRKFVVKLYHGIEIDYLGDTLSNWVEEQYSGLLEFEPEKIKKFQDDCHHLFGIDNSKKFNVRRSFPIRVLPNDNKIFIGQE